MDLFVEQYAKALWIESRQMDVMSGAIARALGGEK